MCHMMLPQIAEQVIDTVADTSVFIVASVSVPMMEIMYYNLYTSVIIVCLPVWFNTCIE